MHRIVGILITGVIQVSSSFSYAFTWMPDWSEIDYRQLEGCINEYEPSFLEVHSNSIINILSWVAIIIVLYWLYVALRMFSTRNDKEHYQYRLKNMKRIGIALIITWVLWVVVEMMLYVITIVTM